MEHTGLERELELERRKNREYHEQLRERDKEYAKLKVGPETITYNSIDVAFDRGNTIT